MLHRCWQRVVSAWAPGFLYLLALLPTHPALATFMEQARIPLPGAVHRQVCHPAKQTDRQAGPSLKHNAEPLVDDRGSVDGDGANRYLLNLM